jgi:threonine dehydrogenase-like Zn-dependent dehydrogenase
LRTVHTLGHKAVEVVDLAEPEPKDDLVVVRIEASSICGSEKRGLLRGRPVTIERRP